VFLVSAIACGGDDASSGAPSDGGGVPLSESGVPDGAPVAVGESVLQHHTHATRDGAYVEPLLTKTAAATMHLDPSFAGTVHGHVYAQPLYVESGPGGKGTFFVATEDDDVVALDESTGAMVWTTHLGTAAASTGVCGNIQPLGITGTPVIDLARRTLYVDGVIASAAGTLGTHQIHALSLDDGGERAGGWPIDVSTISAGGAQFNAQPQNQRGALVIVGNTVYVPYGGHYGDCAGSHGEPYRGWVVAVPLDNPRGASAFATQSTEAGIWGPGGLASDGVDVFATSGNGSGSVWGGQDAVLRLHTGATFSGQSADYYAPSNWAALDRGDVDLGGSGPLLVDTGSAKYVVALGKDGSAYVVDRTNLGGIGS
jgi:hypothetical protein